MGWLGRLIQKDGKEYVEPPGIGLAWLWKLPDTHPFFMAAVRHDKQYDLMREGQSPWRSSEMPDYFFYSECVHAASQQPDAKLITKYVKQARLFYCLTRCWGKMRWRNPK